MNRAILTCDSLEKPRRMNSDTELWFSLPKLCMVICLLKTGLLRSVLGLGGGRTELTEAESHAHTFHNSLHRIGQTFVELHEKGKAALALENKSEDLDSYL